VNCDLRLDDEQITDTDMIEHRLRVGYILLPSSHIGAARWESISAISHSEEMAPYSIGGPDGRPIPRRILETRGVSRTMFGMVKRGSAILSFCYENESRMLSKESRTAAESFLNRDEGYRPGGFGFYLRGAGHERFNHLLGLGFCRAILLHRGP